MKILDWKWVSLALLACGLLLVGCSESSSESTGPGGSGGEAGAGGVGGTAGSGGTAGPTVTFSGIAWSFEFPGTPYGRIAGATISVLEMPELETTSNEDGEFSIGGLPVGSQATLVLEHENHPLTYGKTHAVPDRDLDDVTFQIPTNGLFFLIETGLEIETDPAKCQIVSTFTRVGRTIGDDGHTVSPVPSYRSHRRSTPRKAPSTSTTKSNPTVADPIPRSMAAFSF